MGHGHVIPNADGTKARCGGPALCAVCAIEAAQQRMTQAPNGQPIGDPSDSLPYIRIKFQHGPIREVGVNGCQVDDVIKIARAQLESFNKISPCRETALAITKLDEAIHWLEHRTRDREARGVEGTSAA